MVPLWNLQKKTRWTAVLPSHLFFLPYQGNPKSNPPSQHPFFTYISQKKDPQICSKKENPHFFFFSSSFLQSFFFMYLYQPPRNSICWRKSTFFSSISFPFRKLEYLSLTFGESFPPMYAAKSISSFQKYFCLPSLSVHAFVRVDQQPQFSCQTIKMKIKRIKPKRVSNLATYKRIK